MEKHEYALIQQKKGAFGYVVSVFLLLFFAGGIVASITNMIGNFNFTSILVGLVMIGVCIGLGYVVVKSFYNKRTPIIVVDDLGITPQNITLVKNTLLKWQEVKVSTVYNEYAKARILQILPNSGGPVFISENHTKEFDALVADVTARYENAKQRAVNLSTLSSVGTSVVSGQLGGDLLAQARARAVAWWETSGKDEAICDGCNQPLSKGTGFLVGSYLYCHSCVPRT